VSPPVIGLCAAVERVAWGPWDAVAAMLPRTYVDAVQRAGGIAVLLPPDDRVEVEPDGLLELLDGLLLAGGCDIDPRSYGAPPDARVVATSPQRDSFEVALARRALERDMPVLGVCRGMQLLNVATGGGLVTHLPDVLGHEEHRPTLGVFADHGVELARGSLAARAAGAERAVVRSHHHQGLDGLGRGWRASGWAADGVVEAVEAPDRSFALGVLWHSEQDPASRVVEALVEAAAGAARRSPGRAEALS
jgi:putative glutamine amidotransferase